MINTSPHRENGYQIRRRIYAVLATKTRQHGKPRGLMWCHPYTVLRLFLTDHEDSIRQDIRQSTSFFPFHTVAVTILWDRSVILTVSRCRLCSIHGVRRSPSTNARINRIRDIIVRIILCRCEIAFFG